MTVAACCTIRSSNARQRRGWGCVASRCASECRYRHKGAPAEHAKTTAQLPACTWGQRRPLTPEESRSASPASSISFALGRGPMSEIASASSRRRCTLASLLPGWYCTPTARGIAVAVLPSSRSTVNCRFRRATVLSLSPRGYSSLEFRRFSRCAPDPGLGAPCVL